MIRTILASPLRSCSAQIAAALTLLAGALALTATPASAVVNGSVRSACMSDYFAFCAGYEVGSRELRSCMSKAGPRLSSSCVSALVAAGEVSKAEVDRRSSRGAKVASARSTKVAFAKKKKRAKATRVAARQSLRLATATSRSKASRRQYATLR